MRPRDRQFAQQLDEALLSFDRAKHPLRGIRHAANRSAFLEQLLESLHRVRFIAVLRTRMLSGRRADPNDAMFDPLKSAILHQRRGNLEEAFWLVFLFVHFGKSARGGWRYAREVYGRLGGPGQWDWNRTSSSPSEFREWLAAHRGELERKGAPGGFGNHRKYESLDAYSTRGTGEVVESYVRWVDPPRTHKGLVELAYRHAGGDPRETFDELYRSMVGVARFGRTARFDYLAMLGKLGLAAVEPLSAYLAGSTGPLRGARLLFGADESAAVLDQWLVELDARLGIGMQVFEDALCNWQKSPDKFVPFRG